jgi:catechol 2,3-dioxygenase-like lactoylglutathione lyase family enzyme
MFNQINNVLLFVQDLKKSTEFYNKKLGLSIKMQEEGYIEFELEGAILGIVDVHEGANMISEELILGPRGSAHSFSLAAEVSDVDGIYKQLSEMGVEFIKKPFTQPWGQRCAYFEDPDGNIWEIHAG